MKNSFKLTCGLEIDKNEKFLENLAGVFVLGHGLTVSQAETAARNVVLLLTDSISFREVMKKVLKKNEI